MINLDELNQVNFGSITDDEASAIAERILSVEDVPTKHDLILSLVDRFEMISEDSEKGADENTIKANKGVVKILLNEKIKSELNIIQNSPAYAKA